jgi:hypothetical protein
MELGPAFWTAVGSAAAVVVGAVVIGWKRIMTTRANIAHKATLNRNTTEQQANTARRGELWEYIERLQKDFDKERAERRQDRIELEARLLEERRKTEDCQKGKEEAIQFKVRAEAWIVLMYGKTVHMYDTCRDILKLSNAEQVMSRVQKEKTGERLDKVENTVKDAAAVVVQTAAAVAQHQTVSPSESGTSTRTLPPANPGET